MRGYVIWRTDLVAIAWSDRSPPSPIPEGFHDDRSRALPWPAGAFAHCAHGRGRDPSVALGQIPPRGSPPRNRLLAAAKVGQTLRYTASVAAIWPPAGLGIAA